MSSTKRIRLLMSALCLTTLAVVTACRQDMHDQPKLKTYREGADRAPVEGTVPRGALKNDALVPQKTAAPAAPGTSAAPGAPARSTAKVADDFPFAVTAAVLERGQNRYTVYCTPCHSVLGDGNGMIVQRGFRRPPSYLEERLRNSPASHFYDVMSNGFGAMASYSDKLSPEDRWNVAAYIRALQLSQRASVADVPPLDRAKLDAAGKEGQGGQHQK